MSKNAVTKNRDCLSKLLTSKLLFGLKSCKHGADQLIIRRCLDLNEKNMCFYLKIVSFIVSFGFLLLKLYILLIGAAAVDFDGLFTVSLPGDFFPRLYKFEVLIVK